MALVKCKECGEQVSTKAKSCPKCGAKRLCFLNQLN
ncbi:zinc-ribbon domain-containing protein [Shewanella xiamenensis]